MPAHAAPGAFAAEARGLQWLREAGALAVPQVRALADGLSELGSIPDVKKHMVLIEAVAGEEWWPFLVTIASTALLAWLTALSWPALTPSSRFFRVLVVLALLGVVVLKFMGRF